jgi:hypothetical protein
MKSNDIRFVGKALGRPKAETEDNKIELKKGKRATKKRIP